jgi:TolA-binding protein
MPDATLRGARAVRLRIRWQREYQSSNREDHPMRRPLCALLAPLLVSVGATAPDTAKEERAPEAYQLGLGMQQRGMHEEAAKYFGDFLRVNARHPLAAEARYRLGACQAELGQRKAAIASLQQALELGGSSFRLRPECRYRLGQALKDEGQLEPAAQQFEAMGKELPADHYLLASAHYAAGECRRDGKDDARAVAEFTAAVAAATGAQASFRFPSLYQLGFAQLRRGEFAAASKAFGDAVAAAGDDAARGECQWLAGDAALRAKDLDRAQKLLSDAAGQKGEFADDAAFGLGWVAVERGDAAAAQRQFQTVVEKHADSPLAGRARLEWGRLQYRAQKYDAAAATLAPLQRDGVDADLRRQAQELAGLCALELGHGDTAVKQLRDALGSAGGADKPRLAYALGEALSNQQQWADALAAYEQVTEPAAADLRGDALYGACFALHKLGRFDESSVRAEAVRKLAPPHRLAAQATFAIGENQFAQKHYDRAAAEYAAVAAPPELRSRAQWKLGWCSYLAGDKAAAAKQFSVIAQQERDPFREEALSMQALGLLEAGKADDALQVADAYLARYPKGQFLDRTERVAARVLRQRGDLASAQKRLERAAASAKGSDQAGDVLEEAELVYQQGDFKRAQELYGRLATAADRSGARAIEGLAWCAFELGDDAQCQQRIAAGLQHPQLGDLKAGLLELQSSLQHRRKDWPAAIAAAQAFLAEFAAHPKAPAIRYALGVAQARSGDAKSARATLAALVRDGGYERMDRVHYELAWACRADNDEPAALAAFARAASLSKDPDIAGEANLHLGTAALEQKDEAKARAFLGKVDGKWKGRALYRLGFLDFDAAGAAPVGPTGGANAERLERAKTEFAAVAALPQEPLAAEAGFLVGECCMKLGDCAHAAPQFRALLQQAPQHERAATARLALGECDIELGNADEAVAALEEFLRARPADKTEAARAHLLLGRARLLRKEHDRAEAAFAKVTELSDGALGAEAQFRLGESRAMRGDLEGAADAFVKLPILYAQEEWVRRGLLQAGLCYERLQQPGKARRFFDELVRRFPQSQEGKEAQSHLRGV